MSWLKKILTTILDLLASNGRHNPGPPTKKVNRKRLEVERKAVDESLRHKHDTR